MSISDHSVSVVALLGRRRLRRVGKFGLLLVAQSLLATLGTTAIAAAEAPQPLTTGGSSISNLTDVGGTLFFSLDDPAGAGKELWRSDGSPGGTKLVKDIREGTSDSNPTGLTGMGSVVYFAANDGEHGVELWKSDGTEAGTKLVKDIDETGSSSPSGLVDVGGLLYFSADDGEHGAELWESDGTAGGTKMVKDINEGPGPSGPRNLTDLGGELIFVADDDEHGEELWHRGGPAAVPKLLKDINEGPASSVPGWLPPRLSEPVGGTMFFSADDGEHGYELWKTNGTSGGTQFVKDINPTGDSFPIGFLSYGGRAYFDADDGEHGVETWKTDGTVAGTKLVKDIDTGTGNVSTTGRAVINGTVLFNAADPIHGVELWKSDTTASGTLLVKDINEGVASSYSSELIEVEGEAFFKADDGEHGVELWQSDATEGGTQMVEDLAPGAPSSNPLWLTESNGKLFFVTGEGSGSSLQLWSLTPTRSDGDEDGIADDLDPEPGVGSDVFDDGTGTSGAIGERNGLEVRVTDADPPDGVVIKVGPGVGSVDLAVCAGTGEFTLKVAAESELVLTCGSVSVQLVEGEAEVLLAEGSIVVTVPLGSKAKVSDEGDGNYKVENLGEGNVTVTQGGSEQTVGEGESQAVKDVQPTAVDDSKTLLEDAGATAIDVLANDTDPDGGPKAVTAKTDGAHGKVAITGGGAGLTYAPAANYCGADSFTYELNGGSSATVSVTVTCVGDLPAGSEGQGAPPVSSAPSGQAPTAHASPRAYQACIAKVGKAFLLARKAAMRKHGKVRSRAIKAAHKKKSKSVAKCMKRFHKGRGRRHAGRPRKHHRAQQ